MPHPTSRATVGPFVRSLLGTLLLGGAATFATTAWSPSGSSPAPRSTAPAAQTADSVPDPTVDDVLVAGPDGQPVLDAAGDVLVVDVSQATEVLAGAGDPDGDGLDANGDALEWVAHEHLDELVESGAVTAVAPDDPALGAICAGDVASDPCDVAG